MAGNASPTRFSHLLDELESNVGALTEQVQRLSANCQQVAHMQDAMVTVCSSWCDWLKNAQSLNARGILEEVMGGVDTQAMPVDEKD